MPKIVQPPSPTKAPIIGIFDSGVGGLSVLRHLWVELPGLPMIYVADQANVPYGPRSLEQVRDYSEQITRWLLEHGASLVVVACNTASAAALNHLRQVFPQIPFVGMEPAVKPAAVLTQSGVVGVLATPATFQGALYASVVERFANGVKLQQSTCPGLVQQIEKGRLKTSKTRAILEEALQPMLAQGIDTVVLGCTHYPFVIPMIEKITGPHVQVIDPAPSVARQARRLLGLEKSGEIVENPTLEPGNPTTVTQFFTSGDPAQLQRLLPVLLGSDAQVNGLQWLDGKL